MAEPIAPHDIARHSFEVARRGYEQQAVRGYLHEVSALVERTLRSERELRERAERAEARLAITESPDEAAMLEVLGEETTRVLTSARDAAAEIRSKAEASAERLIAEALADAAESRRVAAADAEAALADARAESERILETARTELERRSAEAEEVAERICEGGAAQAEALREEGQRELDAAREEAEALLESARRDGRTMVAEAQAVRERVLRDLAGRRKKARIQVEKLNAGRERLLEAYDVVRRTIDEATGELTVSLSDARIAADAAARRLEAEPEPTMEELDEEVANAGPVDLPIAEVTTGVVEDTEEPDTPGPFSGEVPAVAAEPAETTRPEDPAASEASAAPIEERRGRRSRRRKGADAVLPPSEVTRLEPADLTEGVRIVAEPAAEPAATAADDTTPEPTAAPAEPSAEKAVPEAGSASGEPAQAPAAESPEPAAEEPAPEPTSAPDEIAEGPAAEDAVSPAEPTADVDDVFARLRADQTGEPSDAPGGEPPPEPSEDVPDAAAEADDSTVVDEPEPGGEQEATVTPFTLRDEALVPIDKDLSRRLKRALADEQNEVLDLLRRQKPTGVDDVLPSVDDHAARWADAAAPVLHDAAAAGATWAGGSPGSVTDVAHELAQGLVAPLRERIDRGFAASDGNLDDVADRVRALYREWKGKRLTETSQHFVAAAYARGAFDAVEAGTEVRWTVDPSGAPCPDCDDNVLAGALAKGEQFPTGTPCAPAHPGCRCLVVPA